VLAYLQNRNLLHPTKRKIDLYWQKPKHQKRINQHFTGTTTKCKKIQDEVFTYDETGSELIASKKVRK
jgi:DNA polymerase-3 subunit epsilon